MAEEQEEKTRLQLRKERHQEMVKERKADRDRLKIAYKKASNEEVLEDILGKIKNFINYHTQVARDGVGGKPTGQVDKQNQPIIDYVPLSKEERLTHLDKAAGQEEVLNYINRMLADDPAEKKKEKTDEADDDSEEN
jgi:hypothetical protein